MTQEIVKDTANQQEDLPTTKRVKKRVVTHESDGKGFKRAKTTQHPRWHNQSYMLFLALRQHTEKSMPRGELIKKALALDRKISAELHLPKVFRGRTPANSASAILTNNFDHYFIPFKPEGSRSIHFKLAYEPGDTETAVQEYQKWCKKLVEHDWPYCFGIPKVDLTTKEEEQENHYHTPVSVTEVQDQEITIPEKQLAAQIQTIAITESQKEVSGSTHEGATPEKSSDDATTLSYIKDSNSVSQVQTSIAEIQVESTQEQPSLTENVTESISQTQLIPTTTENNVLVQEPASTETKKANVSSPKQNKKIVVEPAPIYTLEQLDLSDIPKHWTDIVEVKPSLIPGAGNGLFAKRKLPYNTPIGFYFGVPMTEDEFDSLKDRVGRSSEYSIMYRRTVLDATDEKGEPITDQESPRFCAFHFMNETNETGANVAFVEGVVVNQVICWTRKDIEAGEELLVWYGADVNRYWNDNKENKKELDNSTDSDSSTLVAASPSKDVK